MKEKIVTEVVKKWLFKFHLSSIAFGIVKK